VVSGFPKTACGNNKSEYADVSVKHQHIPMRLLVTGFGPFPRMPRNPSAALARSVAAAPRLRRLGIEARAAVLTTAYATLAAELDPLLAERPDAVLMIGVAGRERQVRVETRATSRRSTLFPDRHGEVPRRAGAEGAREAARRSRVNAGAALRALLRHGLPARISRDAGRYLCNAAYFRALTRRGPTLFIHIPKPPKAGRKGARAKRTASGPSQALTEAMVEVAVLLAREARAVVAASGIR